MRLLILSLLLVAATAGPAHARGRSHSADGHVVHSRRAPVIMHRAVPPFSGVHVYDKSAKQDGTGRRASRARNAEVIEVEIGESSPAFERPVHSEIDHRSDQNRE